MHVIHVLLFLCAPDVTDRFWDQARRIGFDDALEAHDKLDSEHSTESP